ncbi:MAG: HIT family protein [Pseudomonadota bacterium]
MERDCLFCRIASGEAAAHIVHRDDRCVAFLDHAPIREGHVQIIPVAHFESFELLPAADAHAILDLGQRIAQAQKALFGVPRVGFLFTGGDIDHVHAHLVPLVEKTDITSTAYIRTPQLQFGAAPHADADALRTTADRLRAAL